MDTAKDAKPGFRTIYVTASKIRLGEAEALFARANVTDTESRGYRSTMQSGLLTETGLESLAGKKPTALRLQGCCMASQTGTLNPKPGGLQMYLITLDNLWCCQTLRVHVSKEYIRWPLSSPQKGALGPKYMLFGHMDT